MVSSLGDQYTADLTEEEQVEVEDLTDCNLPKGYYILLQCKKASG